MFDTGLIRDLQSLSSDWLTILMLFITGLGSSPFFSAMAAVIMLGVSFRKGFILAHMAIWASVLTDLFKNLFALPRPYQVDSRVAHLDISTFTGEELYSRARDIFGAGGSASYGFPSGHVSATTTVWGGVSLLFESRVARAVAVPMVALMALSRMYLGRHFLADVLGGFVLGAAVVLASGLLLRRKAHARALSAYLLLAPLPALALVPLTDPEDAGRLLGLNVAFLLVSRNGLPADSGSRMKRAARVLLGLAFLILTRLTFSLLLPEEGLWIRLAQGFASHFLLVWATVETGVRLNLFTREAGQ